MPPQRTPLRAINGNRKGRGPDLSPYLRGKIIGHAKAGDSPAEIQVALSVRGAVRGSITQDNARPNGESAPHSGCPPTYTDRDERIMLRHLRLYLKSTFNERRQDCDTKMSNSTIKRLARKHGL